MLVETFETVAFWSKLDEVYANVKAAVEGALADQGTLGERLRAARDNAEIMQCYYVTGQADFVMVLTSRSMEAYDAFVERFLFSNRNVRRFETMVVMDRVKVGFDLPIDAD